MLLLRTSRLRGFLAALLAVFQPVGVALMHCAPRAAPVEAAQACHHVPGPDAPPDDGAPSHSSPPICSLCCCLPGPVTVNHPDVGALLRVPTHYLVVTTVAGDQVRPPLPRLLPFAIAPPFAA